MKRDAIDLGTMKVSYLFRRLFVPTLFGMLSISAVTVIDGIFVGRGVGSDGIAAVNLCIPLLMLFTGIGLMCGVGSSVVASVHLSQDNGKAARLNVTQALAFVTLLTLIPVALIMTFTSQTATLLGTSEHLRQMTVDYLKWFIPGLVFQMWSAVSLFVIRLDGSPRFAMMCSVVPALLNVLLDWLFIFPLGYGVAGAAAASTLSMMVGGMMAVSYLFFKADKLKPTRLKASRKSLALTFRNIGYQCKIGSSALLGEATLAVLMFVGNNVFMKYLSDDGVGAFGIACYYIPFVFMVGNAIAQSAQPIISYNYGAGKSDRVSLAGKYALMTAFVSGAIVSVCFALVPEGMVALFLDTDTSSAAIAVEGFPYFATGFVPFVVNLASIGYYQSVEKAFPAAVFSLMRGFLFLVPSFLFLPELLGVRGIWLAMPVSESLTVIAIAGYHYVVHNLLKGAANQNH